MLEGWACLEIGSKSHISLQFEGKTSLVTPFFLCIFGFSIKKSTEYVKIKKFYRGSLLGWATLSYAGFLRFSELANLKRSNVTFFPTHVKLFLEQSKTDVYREGRDVVISKTGNNTCPVAMLEHYMKLAKISENSDEFIFRSLSYCSKSDTYKLRKNLPLSYTRAREVLLNALETIGLDKKTVWSSQFTFRWSNRCSSSRSWRSSI